MLLSAAPIAKVIRVCVWLAIHEGLIEPRVLQSRPEELIQELAFLNSLIIFYLGDDFLQKLKEAGFALS